MHWILSIKKTFKTFVQYNQIIKSNKEKLKLQVLKCDPFFAK
jgi:hypothetical protein